KEAIYKDLEHEEEIERRNQEAAEAWQKYQKTGEFVSNQDMIAWLDTWGTDREKPCPKITKPN
ncbi:MAG: CopG family transcriptional regulator, partial [Rickettsiales bacterium]